MIFSSKARTLDKFSKKSLKYSSVPKIYFFSVNEFNKDPNKIINVIRSYINNEMNNNQVYLL